MVNISMAGIVRLRRLKTRIPGVYGPLASMFLHFRFAVIPLYLQQKFHL